MSAATIAKFDVVPVAGHDSMLLNLSGAHGPFFTRNIAIVTDSDPDLELAECWLKTAALRRALEPVGATPKAQCSSG